MKSKSKIFYVTPLDVVKDPGSGKPPEKSNDDIDDLMNLKFDKTPQIFKDCIPILFLARLIRIHPISYEKERELKGICPLTFSWKSWESLIAYIQFAALVVLGLISVSFHMQSQNIIIFYLDCLDLHQCNIIIFCPGSYWSRFQRTTMRHCLGPAYCHILYEKHA